MKVADFFDLKDSFDFECLVWRSEVRAESFTAALLREGSALICGFLIGRFIQGFVGSGSICPRSNYSFFYAAVRGLSRLGCLGGQGFLTRRDALSRA